MSQAALIKNPSPALLSRLNIGILFIAVLMFLLVFAVFSKGCSKESDNANNSFLTGARMGAPILIVSDTLNKDSLLQAEWKVYLDSALNHTSISQLNDFVEGNVTVKDYPNVKFADVVNGFIRQQQQLFLQKKQKK